MRDLLVSFGVAVDQSQLIEAQKKTDGLLKTFKNGARVLQGFAAALGVRAIVGFFKDTVALGDGLVDLAARLGITTDELQLLQQIAKEAGTSFSSVQTGFRTLADQMVRGADEFGKLGVATKNADGSLRSVTDVFFDVGGALGDTTDQAERLAIAQKLMGRGAIELMPAFTGGAEAVAKMRQEMSEYAIVVDAEFAEAADKAQKKLDIFSARLARLRVLLVTQVLPAIEWLVVQITKAVVVLQKFVSSGHALQSFMVVATALFLNWAAGVRLGATMVTRLLPLVRGLLRFLLRFALPVLIIDELITLFRGGDTLIGRFLDKLFGIGTATKFVEGAKMAFQSLVDTLVLVLQWLGIIEGKPADLEAAFLRASEGIGRAFDALFSWLGEQFTRFITWLGKKIQEIPGVKQALEFAGIKEGAKPAGGQDPWAQAWEGVTGGWGAAAPAAIAPEPALAPTRAGGANVNAPVSVQNNITVEGNATPAVAREIATKTGKATAATVGRDRSAIGAAMGIP